ncbi:venom nerve growth factor 1-like [Mya arenaria]|uniref:venom nerve growth factor 1-like n=1 Tax=Mya arenaria TaxID=6604 RepID=UPI0022E8E1FE|nr:venom nerve growth factor 1-like [Mya arenaria]
MQGRHSGSTHNNYEDFKRNQMDLRGLYSTLKAHPALMNRRMMVNGHNPPPLPVDWDEAAGELSVSKRFDMGMAQSVCPVKISWELISRARDMNGTEVEVFQPLDSSDRFQWFYTVTCDQRRLQERENCPQCCYAINTQMYLSRCVPRQSYVMALIWRPEMASYDWGYIQVDSSCDCAITPKH